MQTLRPRLYPVLGWAAFALVTVYTLALSVFGFLNAGWKPHRVETAWFLFSFAFLVGLVGCLRLSTRSKDSTFHAPNGRARLGLACVMAVAIVVYSHALAVGFLSDDFVLLELGELGAGWRQGTSQFVRVLPVALLQAIDIVGPTWNGTVAHAVNLALHLTNGLLIFHIARRLHQHATASVVAAALFLLFPASPEAVVWVSGLQDVLMATASLAFVLVSLDARHPVVLVGCFAVGLLSKETAVAMPLLAAAAVWARGTKTPPAVLRTLAACASIAVAFGVWRLQSGGGTFATPPTRYLAKEILAGAFGTLAVPWMTAELQQAALLGMVMATLVALGAWAVLWTGEPAAVPRVAALGIGWVILSVAPVYSLFFVSDTLQGSRYLYLPSAGWALAIASASALVDSPIARVFRWVVGAVVVSWAIGTYGHVLLWTQASAERDRIIAAAATARDADCSAVTFVRATDNVNGAYVFRNGLESALRRAGVSADDDVAEPTTCVFSWTGDAFVRTR